MLSFLVALVIAITGMSHHVGYTSYYSPGVMEATVEARQEWGHIPQRVDGYAGFVARPSCDEIGDTVWIRLSDTGSYRPYLVADCAVRDNSDGALGWMISNRILAEFGYNSAAELGIIEYRQEIEMVK